MKPWMWIVSSLLAVAAHAAHADVPEHAPRPELRCEAECWWTNGSSAQYGETVIAWGARTAPQLMAELRARCPAPLFLTHSYLIEVNRQTVTDSYWQSYRSRTWYADFWGYLRLVSSNASFYATATHERSSLRIGFDRVTADSACRPLSDRFEAGEAGG